MRTERPRILRSNYRKTLDPLPAPARRCLYRLMINRGDLFLRSPKNGLDMAHYCGLSRKDLGKRSCVGPATVQMLVRLRMLKYTQRPFRDFQFSRYEDYQLSARGAKVAAKIVAEEEAKEEAKKARWSQ